MSGLTERGTLNPYLVLAIALVLPGGGHVAAGAPERGLGFAFFTLLFAIVTWHFSTPDQSFVARSAAGLFVWALSVPDAYRIARAKYEIWKSRSRAR